jgi:group I intron endonuclease
MVKPIYGSSVDLGKRFGNYFSIYYLLNSKANMLINKALLKYGYSNFKLEILEYCEPSVAIEREQHYLDLLEPEYNILSKAGSRLGQKHTEETRAKFRARKLSKKHIAALTKHNSSLEQRLKSKERIIKINAEKGFVVEVTNIESGEVVKYESIRQTAKELNTSHVTVMNYIKNKKLYLGKYIIKTGI